MGYVEKLSTWDFKNRHSRWKDTWSVVRQNSAEINFFSCIPCYSHRPFIKTVSPLERDHLFLHHGCRLLDHKPLTLLSRGLLVYLICLTMPFYLTLSPVISGYTQSLSDRGCPYRPMSQAGAGEKRIVLLTVTSISLDLEQVVRSCSHSAVIISPVTVLMKMLTEPPASSTHIEAKKNRIVVNKYVVMTINLSPYIHITYGSASIFHPTKHTTDNTSVFHPATDIFTSISSLFLWATGKLSAVASTFHSATGLLTP